MRITTRLLLGSLLVVSVLVVVVLALSGIRLRAQLRALSTDQLARDARFVAAEWTPAVRPDALADAAGAALHRRVTLIDSAGTVVGDSEFDGAALAGLQNHATRPEVVEARRGGVGSALRVSPSEGDSELYVAVRAPLGVARVSMRTAQLDEIVGRAQRDVLVSGLVALGVAALLALLFSRTVTRPVIELRDVAQALAGGDLSRRPALAAPGEVGELAAAVHRMSEQLELRLRDLSASEALHAATIESLNEGIVVVDERRRVERINESGRRILGVRDAVPFPADLLPRDRTLRDSLGRALAGRATEQTEFPFAAASGPPRVLALRARPLAGGGAVLAILDLTPTRRLEAVRRDFVANVSHELKTPLTVIRGFAETLAAEERDAHLRGFAETIGANAHRMQRLVDDLLDLSRIESGGWVPAPATIDAAAAAADAIASSAPDAAEREVSLAAAVAPDAATLRADPTALRQILTNLVANAVRYTPRGGRVTVFTERAADGAWVGVRDSGIGIAAEHLPRIFERFYRVDPARSRAEGGTGLGLAIVKHLAEAHGGRVRAESAPGRGTTIAAFFPDG